MYFAHQFYSVVHTRHGWTNGFSFSNHLDHLAFRTVGASWFGVPPADILMANSSVRISHSTKSHQASTTTSSTAGGWRPPLILERPPLILCAALGPLLHCGAARLTRAPDAVIIVDHLHENQEIKKWFNTYFGIENHLPRTQSASISF